MYVHVPQQAIGFSAEHPEKLATVILYGAPRLLREPQQQGETLFVLVRCLRMRGRLFWKGPLLPPGARAVPLTLDCGGEKALQESSPFAL